MCPNTVWGHRRCLVPLPTGHGPSSLRWRCHHRAGPALRRKANHDRAATRDRRRHAPPRRAWTAVHRPVRRQQRLLHRCGFVRRRTEELRRDWRYVGRSGYVRSGSLLEEVRSLPKIMRRHDEPLIWNACVQMLGFAAPRTKILRQRMWAQCRAPAVDVSRVGDRAVGAAYPALPLDFAETQCRPGP